MDKKMNRIKYNENNEQEQKIDSIKGIEIDIKKEDLARGIVIAEILGKPVSLRKDRWGNGPKGTNS